MIAMSAPPLVSIILPTFNRLQYLKPAVDSVISQTLEDWELIVADDGSGAETRSYLSALQCMPRVKVVWLEHQGNPGVARNRALREARAPYVAFLDSDDLWMPPKLELQLAAMHARKDRSWSYTEFIRIDPSGASIDFQRNPDRVLHEGRIVQPLLRLASGIAMPTVMVERELLNRAGGFDERLALHEDYELWLRLALLSDVSVIRQPLACVRRHDEHFSCSGVRSYEARCRVLEKLRDVLSDPRDSAVLESESARSMARLALANAAAGNRRAMWHSLARGWTHSWRNLGWYPRAAHSVARSFAPSWLVAAVRGRRRTEPSAAGHP
jgi:glycosyltransferase involved in cell wall biosynthesis